MDLLKVIVFFLLAAVLIIVSPLLSIWALNTVFELHIATDLGTWLAMAWLHLILANGTLKGSFKV